MTRSWLLGAICFLAFSRAAHGSTLDVTSFGAVADDGNSDTAAIAAAIAASQPGDTVFFPAGMYLLSDAIYPASGTTLAGAARDTTILRYNGATLLPLVDLSGRTNIELTALTLDGGGSAKAANGIQAVGGSGHRLHGLAIRALVKGQGFGPHGIHFVDNVTDSEIADNLVSDIAPTSAWGAGIRLSHGSARNRVLRNTIATTGRGGILADNFGYTASLPTATAAVEADLYGHLRHGRRPRLTAVEYRRGGGQLPAARLPRRAGARRGVLVGIHRVSEKWPAWQGAASRAPGTNLRRSQRA